MLPPTPLAFTSLLAPTLCTDVGTHGEHILIIIALNGDIHCRVQIWEDRPLFVSVHQANLGSTVRC